MLGIPKEGRQIVAWRRGADKTLRAWWGHPCRWKYASFYSPNMQDQGCRFAPGLPVGVESQPLHYENVNAHILFISRILRGPSFSGNNSMQYTAFELSRKGSCHEPSLLPEDTSLLRSSFRKPSFQSDKFHLKARIVDGRARLTYA